MLAKNPYQNYQQNSIMSARPEELTTMLYNRLVKDLKLANEAITKNDSQMSHNAIIHAQEILNHLMITLDTSLEVGQNLNLMYDYMSRRLMEANMKKDSAMVNEVCGFAEEIRDTWVLALKQLRAGVAVGS